MSSTANISGLSDLSKINSRFKSISVTVQTELNNNIKNELEEIKNKKNKYIEIYNIKINEISSSNLSPSSKQSQIEQINIDHQIQLDDIENDIKLKTQELNNRSLAYKNQEKENIRTKNKLSNDISYSKKNYSKFSKKRISSFNLVSKLSILINTIISSVSLGNKKIEKLIDDVNNDIKNIKNESDIQKAKLQVNRIKSIIAQNKKKLNNIGDITKVLEVLIPLLDIILRFLKINPIPSSVPPGVGVPLGVITSLGYKTKTLDDLKISSSIILNIINQIISKLIDDLNYQESRLLLIEALLLQGLEQLDNIEDILEKKFKLKIEDYTVFEFVMMNKKCRETIERRELKNNKR